MILRLLFLAGLAAALVACEPSTAPSASETASAAPIGSCIACHGRDGRARIDGYPHLAGQNQTYLYQQLMAFKNNERKHPAMQAAVGPFDPSRLRAMAAYYAALPANAEDLP